MMNTANYLQRLLLRVQGIYFLITGIWPVIHIASFIFITGPKTDLWLVKTLGIIFFCEGICFLLGGIDQKPGSPIKALACINTLALTGVDVYYVITGTISPIYLADAGIEFIFLLCWIYTFFRNTDT